MLDNDSTVYWVAVPPLPAIPILEGVGDIESIKETLIGKGLLRRDPYAVNEAERTRRVEEIQRRGYRFSQSESMKHDTEVRDILAAPPPRPPDWNVDAAITRLKEMGVISQN